MACRLTTLITQLRFASFLHEAMTLARRRNLAGSFDEKAMTAAIEDFAKEAERVEKSRQDAIRDADRAKLAKINDALVQAERQFIDPRGLRGRAWYKHQIYAPGFYTGYAAQPLTDFRQALDDRNYARHAKESLERIVEAIKARDEHTKTSSISRFRSVCHTDLIRLSLPRYPASHSASRSSSLSFQLQAGVCSRLRGSDCASSLSSSKLATSASALRLSAERLQLRHDRIH